jgi:hypothetical protein
MAQRYFQARLAHPWRAQQHNVVTVSHQAACARIDRGLGLEFKPLQGAHEREAGDGQGHRQSTLFLARHLSGAEPSQGLTLVQLPAGRFFQ